MKTLFLLVATAILLYLPGVSFTYSQEDSLAGARSLTDNALSVAPDKEMIITDTVATIITTAIATWYDEKNCLNCHPELIMANGEKLDATKFTAAYDGVPLGTYVNVWYQDKKVRVKITDRIGNEKIDLSREAFKCLAPLDKGKIKVGIVYSLSGNNY